MSLKYVVITPARNEAEYIDRTARSMAAQTQVPERWVVVSDGSTDGTDDIVRGYAQSCPWLELARLPEERDRSFAAKVHAFNAGYERVEQLDFDVVVCLDADITFEADYFEFLLDKMAARPRLGVAGTHYIEGDFHSYNDSYMSVEHVNGGCQVFRRECFEDIGGLVPIKGGGIDWVAVTTARMKGWETRSFEQRTFNHLRKIGTAGGNELKARFHYGKKDYFLGGHPLWQIARSTFQVAKRPYILGGAALLLGYTWCWLTRHERPVSAELMAFHRREQLHRLRELVLGRLLPGRTDASTRPAGTEG